MDKDVKYTLDVFNEKDIAFKIDNNSNNDAKIPYKIYFNGNSYQDGVSSYRGTNYGEMFEWADGNPNNEDRIGRFVTMKDDKILFANNNEQYIIGVISYNNIVLGDEPMQWHDKYSNDEWERPIYIKHNFEIEKQIKDENGNIVRNITLHKKNCRACRQNFDEKIEYIPRRFRKEWSPVAIMGKVIVLQDGTLKNSGFCSPSINGIATNSENGYYVMKVLNDEQALILLK